MATRVIPFKKVHYEKQPEKQSFNVTSSNDGTIGGRGEFDQQDDDDDIFHEEKLDFSTMIYSDVRKEKEKEMEKEKDAPIVLMFEKEYKDTHNYELKGLQLRQAKVNALTSFMKMK